MRKLIATIRPYAFMVLCLCIFWELDFMKARQLPFSWYFFIVPQIVLAAHLFWWAMRDAEREEQHAVAPPRAPHLDSAYLVIHLDIKQQPPVAVFAHIYSSSGQDLTIFGGEAHVDLYRIRARTFHEAQQEMEKIVPIYFPWVVPLMTRRR